MQNRRKEKSLRKFERNMNWFMLFAGVGWLVAIGSEVPWDKLDWNDFRFDPVPYLPLVTIFGPIIGAVIGASVTLSYIAKRKRLSIQTSETQNVRQDKPTQVYPFDQPIVWNEIPELRHTRVRVWNVGNTTISSLNFVIVMTNPCQNLRVLVVGSSRQLEEAVKHEIEITESETRIKVTIPFLNPDEGFSVRLRWQGAADDIKVYCRMEDVSVAIDDV